MTDTTSAALEPAEKPSLRDRAIKFVKTLWAMPAIQSAVLIWLVRGLGSATGAGVIVAIADAIVRSAA